MGQFADKVKQWSAKVKNGLNATTQEVILGVAKSLIDYSPVGDPALWKNRAQAEYAVRHGYVGGNFKANWQGGSGEVNYLVTGDIDPSGDTSLISIQSQIPPDATKEIFYITNSLPYAERLEDGWSTQAPAGMVDLTIIDFKNIVNVSLAKVAI